MDNAAQKICVDIEWMARRDMPKVLYIENKSFKFPWTEEDFIKHLKQRSCVGLVAEYEKIVIGYMIYELYKTRLHIINFATDPNFRRKGVGATMCNKLIRKLSFQKRYKILLEVSETNLPAQLFFRQMGFRAVSIFRDFYEETAEDAYLMQYILKEEREEEKIVFQGINRINFFTG